MTTSDILLNIDLAAGTAALVMIAMIVVPNLDRIRTLRRGLTRRPVRRAVHEQRLVVGGLSRS